MPSGCAASRTCWRCVPAARGQARRSGGGGGRGPGLDASASQRSPHEPYRRYQARLVDYNCSYAAGLHNLTTAEQRQKAAKKLKGWEDELRALAGDGAS